MARAITLSRDFADAEMALALAAFARTSSLMGVAMVIAADATLRITLPLISLLKGVVA
ncbi:hypothetical protein WAB17_08110 [Parerythrobacter aurantius]|uniref:hypothetical protein n=1 Tax=Parerythrobacter aurantius TaxID=3127706 RepID=UPI0032565C2E